MRNRFDADSNREARLDRRFEQEPSYGRRQRIPVVEAGTLKQRFEASERQELPRFSVPTTPSRWEDSTAECARCPVAGTCVACGRHYPESADVVSVNVPSEDLEVDTTVEKPVVIAPEPVWSPYRSAS
jgi:hypothetical protein